MRLHKIIAEFIYKNLVARVYPAPGNNLATMIGTTGEDIEIMGERLRWGIDKKLLLRADQP